MEMPLTDFLILSAICVATILLFRTAPLMLLRGRELPQGLANALSFIPPAAFAALVANDLLSPTMFDNGLVAGLLPLVAALFVIPVAVKTKSLVWCIVVGVGVYAVLMMLV